MGHVSWSDIESFYNVRKSVQKYPELLEEGASVVYRAKVKLHGTNAGVRISYSGDVIAQSRTSDLSVDNDNAGFAKWVSEREAVLRAVRPEQGDLIVFGEWCGPGIQKGTAINGIPNKTFAVFAARHVIDGKDVRFVVEPFPLERMVWDVPGTHAISWYDGLNQVDIDWRAPAEALQTTVDVINEHVALVEAQDPWVKSEFNVEGIGEGLVFYPIGTLTSDCFRPGALYKTFSDLCFKAKGEKHQVVAKTRSAQIDPTVVSKLSEFAEMVVTEPRCEQGVRAVMGGDLTFDVRMIGQFLKWVNLDLEKEVTLELEASGLDRKQALKVASTRARDWYVARAKDGLT